jgi:Na+/melibiose symporter-like transporter
VTSSPSSPSACCQRRGAGRRPGHARRHARGRDRSASATSVSAEGGYFGWWNFATKLNLALAAGLALPLLRAFGYAPGAREPPALQALTMAYCLLPCVLKLAAGGLLHCCH